MISLILIFNFIASFKLENTFDWATNKLEQMCMERLFGIAFQQEGYDASNSIQGEHFTTPFETLNFQKKFFKRK